MSNELLRDTMAILGPTYFEKGKCLEPKCGNEEMRCIAKGAVDQAICVAAQLIRDDPDGFFLYKCPKLPRSGSEAVSMVNDDELQQQALQEIPNVRWLSIADFELNEAEQQVRQYVDNWQLAPATRFVINSRHVEHVEGKGSHYYVDALFSSPTPKCPNPLAVATVRFALHVSRLLPPHYPIMVTYNFEGHRTNYYALGERSIRSMSFQRYYIDTILHMKLSFFAEICACAHPETPEVMEKEESVAEELNEELDSVQLTHRLSQRLTERLTLVKIKENEDEIMKENQKKEKQ